MIVLNHMQRNRFIIPLIIIIVLGFFAPRPTFSQTGPEVVINYVDPQEQDDGLKLNIFFNLINSEGVILSGNDIDEASLILDDGTKYIPRVTQPSTPIFVTIVLDTSGSMAGSLEQMKNGAIAAIQNAPPQAVFSVIGFNEVVTPLIPFTNDRIAVVNAIQSAQNSNAGTCLYDAMYAAVQTLQNETISQPEARRAAILFTDGQDERTQGAGDTCSTFTLEQVYELALSNTPVPINTIGLESNTGNVNVAELEEIGTRTGGLSIAGSVNQLDSAFAFIMNGLRNQFLAEALVYPEQGNRSATLNISSRSNGLATTATNFNASRTWVQQDIAGISVGLDGVSYDSDADTYRMQLLLSRPEEISELTASIWDETTGTQIDTLQFFDLTSFMSLPLPTDGMKAEQPYTLRVSAKLSDGSRLLNLDEEPFLVVHSIKYAPEIDPLQFFIESQVVDEELKTLTLNIVRQNDSKIVAYEGWLENVDTRVQAASFSAPVSPQVVVSLDSVPEGSYQVVLRGLDESGDQVAITAREFVRVLPPRPGFFGRLFGGLFNNLWIVALMLLSIFGLMGYLMFRNREKKKLTGTPFLSGNIQPPPSKATPLKKTTVHPTQKPLIPPKRSARAVKKPKPSLFIQKSGTLSLASNVIQLNKSPFIIGRKESDFNFDLPTISRQHAEFTHRAGETFIKDMGSSNGTFVNENKLEPNVPLQLRNGMEIRFGSEILVIFEKGLK